MYISLLNIMNSQRILEYAFPPPILVGMMNSFLLSVFFLVASAVAAPPPAVSLDAMSDKQVIDHVDRLLRGDSSRGKMTMAE